ncbi:YvrJ family protein [Bacillus thuringiensis]|nr:YvrJ family protein [Bacillus thuringiensis]MDZ3957036.1 YvrJ family protein [Bacillus thuringiensis]RGP43375.1 YvrJ family protein [Bacillus thuringiensis]
MESNLDIWFTALGNFGFPILITIYLLVRFEKKIDNLIEAIDKLKDAMHQ